MAGPFFPNVPVAIGVPPVLRNAANMAAGTVNLLASDSLSVAQTTASQWGIYTSDGGLALNPDNIAMVNFDAEYRLADYPIEKGGFQTYDKVQMPFDTIVRLTKGGPRSEREAFVKTVEKMRGDYELYSVVTPEATYRNVNIARVTIDRSAESGAGMIIVDMHLREIRQTAAAAFSQTKDPASADAANNGPTQTTSAPANAGEIK
jgi:hypothetical protein